MIRFICFIILCMLLGIAKQKRMLVQFWVWFVIHLCHVLSLSFTTHAEPLVFKSHSHLLRFESVFFKTVDNFDPQDGTFAKLGPNKYYKINQYHFSWDYVATHRHAWKTGLTFGQGESSDGTFTRKNSALTHIYLGYQHYLRATPFKVKPEIMLIYPLTSVNPNADDLLLSEGAFELKAGAWLQKKFFTLDFYFYGGANYRGDGRSSLIEYTLGTQKDFDGLMVGGEMNGFVSVTKDEFSDQPSNRHAVINQVDGGSFKFYSVNPNLLSANVYVRAQFTNAFSLKGGYGLDIQGKNSARGQSIFLQMIWNLSATQQAYTKTRRLEKKNDDLEKFNIESTEYDESLFQEEPPKSIRKKKSIDQMLNEAEKILDKDKEEAK